MNRTLWLVLLITLLFVNPPTQQTDTLAIVPVTYADPGPPDDSNPRKYNRSTAPVTSQPATITETRTEAITEVQALEPFVASVINGNPNQIAGVYVSGILSLPVLQQPAGQAAYVSEQDNTVTQFAATSSYNNVGLLAHNFLSGEDFFLLDISQTVILVYGDGRQETYKIDRIDQFQALNPTSPYSDFIDLNDPAGTKVSSTQLFKRVYTTPNTVVFQTCIKAFGDPSWGRIFVTAKKI